MTATDEVFMRAALLCSLLLGAAACGSDDAASPVDAATDGAIDPDGGSAGPGLGSLRAIEDRWINPETGELSAYSRFDGWYFDGPQPPWHREVARSGACVLRRYTPAFCDPACALGTLCVDTNVCQAPPRFESAGTLTVTGLTVPITLASTTGYYQYTDGLPTDLFTDSATVTATLAGAAVPTHTLTARGVPPLVAAIGNFRTLTPGQDHTITWTPAGGDARVRCCSTPTTSVTARRTSASSTATCPTPTARSPWPRRWSTGSPRPGRGRCAPAATARRRR
jgi:hypothetical protein